MDPALLHLIERYGVFTRGEALSLGYSERDVVRLCRTGIFQRVRHGTYTYAELWAAMTPEAQFLIRSRSAFRTSETESALSHTSALARHGTPSWGLPLDEVHLTRLDGRSGRRTAGVVQHRGRLEACDLDYDDDLVFTSATRTALDIITITNVERATVAIGGLLFEGKTTVRHLADRSVDMWTWPYMGRLELVLRYLDARLESVGERRAWYAFCRTGLVLPEPQYIVRSALGEFLGRVDFAYPDLKVVIEFDGKEKYLRLLKEGQSPADAVIAEKLREDRMREEGWIVLRIVWSDLADPQALAARIRRVRREAAARRITI